MQKYPKYPKSFPPLYIEVPNGDVISIQAATYWDDKKGLSQKHVIIVGFSNTHGHMEMIDYFPVDGNGNDKLTFRTATCYEPQ
jgi:hypothetical protein